MKTDLPQSFIMAKRRWKSLLSTSGSHRTTSFVPTCRIRRLMEWGKVWSSPGSLFIRSVTVAPGKQCVDALKKRMYLVMESPTIAVDGGNSGGGERGELGEAAAAAVASSQ